MADSSIRNLVSITTSDRSADLLYIVDVSDAVGSGDNNVTPQKLLDDAPATAALAGSMSAAHYTKLEGITAGANIYTDEQAQDSVGTILVDSSSIDFTYNDATPSITASVIFGATSGTACQGNDSRLSDARTPTAHTHPSTAITDFSEAVDDRVAAFLVQGSNITLTHDDGANTLTIAATGVGGGYTNEEAQDAVGTILTDSTSIDFTYNDATPSITASAIFGSSAGTIAQGNDSRFTDARTPTNHAASHKSGGGDSIKLDELAAPTDVTTLNASTTAHGLLPKLNNVSTNFLNGQGAWATPATGFTSPTTTKGDLIIRDASTDVRLGVGTNGYGLLADSSTSTGLAYKRSPYLINHQNATITNSAVTGATDTDIWTYSLPANTLGANGILHVVAQMRNFTNATVGSRVAWKFKFGGTTYKQSSTQPASTGTTWHWETYIMNRNATNSQIGQGQGTAVNPWNTTGNAAITSAIDTTSAVTLALSFASFAGATDICTIDYVMVFIIT